MSQSDSLRPGRSSGWTAADDGQWTAWFGSRRDGGKMPDREAAERIAQEWLNMARAVYGGDR